MTDREQSISDREAAIKRAMGEQGDVEFSDRQVEQCANLLTLEQSDTAQGVDVPPAPPAASM